jgi:hypothetical protein
VVEVRTRQRPGPLLGINVVIAHHAHRAGVDVTPSVITNSPLVARPSSGRLRRCPLALA